MRSEELKRRVLELVEKDREFRYALMGYLGFKEILERITKLEERFIKLDERVAKLEERQQRLEERFAELEERFIKLDERVAKLEERFAELEERMVKLEERIARLEERFAELAERQQRLEERFAKLEERVIELEERIVKLEERFAELVERQQRLEERQQKLEERMARVEEELARTRRVVMVVAHRFGVLSEGAFREAMSYVVERLLGVGRVERWVYRDDEGLVYGHPSVVEVDLVVKDGMHVLVEVKSRVSKPDVSELYRIGRLYERVVGVKPRLLIVGGFVDEDARELAKGLGVELVSAIEQ